MTTEPTPAHGPSESITEKPAQPAPPATETPSTAITQMPAAPLPAAPTSPDTPAAPSTDWAKRTDYFLLALLLILSFFLASYTASNSDLDASRSASASVKANSSSASIPIPGRPRRPIRSRPWRDSSAVAICGLSIRSDPNWAGRAWWCSRRSCLRWRCALVMQIGWSTPNRWFIVICLIMAVLAASGRLLSPLVMSLLFVAADLPDEPRRLASPRRR